MNYSVLLNEIAIVEKSGLFDEKWYLAQYPDVRTIGLDAIEHYLKYGWIMGRDPSPSFSTRYYLQSNADVANAGVNPFVHYVTQGIIEGRPPVPSGDQTVVPAQGNLYVPLLQSEPAGEKPAKLISFYLPQFHAMEGSISVGSHV